MTAKIFKSIWGVALIVLLSCLIIITGFIYKDNELTQRSHLQKELHLAALATQELGDVYLKQLPSKTYRLTWISNDGSVLFDNKADPQNMENHANREEIREALQNGNGSSIRYSNTLTEKTLYEAIQLEDGSVLRMSINYDSIAALMVDLLYPIIFISFAALILSILLARQMAKQIVNPLLHLNLDEPLKNDTYEELQPVLFKLNSQHLKIEQQILLLQRKQKEFDLTIKNMKESLILLDTELKIISINQAALTLFNISSENNYSCFFIHNDEYDIVTGIKQALKHGHFEFKVNIQNREYMFNVNRIRSDQKIHGVVILAFDITEQMEAERIRREFTSNVSHELKTPLQSIIGSAELIENGIVKPTDMPRFVGHIRKEASRLVTLIEDIMRLSQLDEESIMPMEEVSLLSIAKEVEETLAYAADEKQVKLLVEGDAAIMNGVPSLLFEMIYNLVDNAIRYNYVNGFVEVKIKETNENIYLSVKDNGIGIPKEHQHKIFERFYRVDKSHSRKSGGTGLGLSIVKHVIQYHQGTIEIDSDLGKGTHITVCFKI